MRIAALGLVLVAAAAAACTPTPQPDVCDEPDYGGEGTDEAWRTLVDAEDDAATGGDAAQITAPDEDAVFGKDALAPTFTWSSTLAGGQTLAPPVRVVARTQRRSSPLDALSALVFPRAHAHEPPITGDAYYAKVTADGPCPIAAIVTTELTWSLDDDAWAALQDAPGAMTFTVVSAYLTDNRVSEGPFVSAPRKFTVE
jgi:hypothetical protein